MPNYPTFGFLVKFNFFLLEMKHCQWLLILIGVNCSYSSFKIMLRQLIGLIIGIKNYWFVLGYGWGLCFFQPYTSYSLLGIQGYHRGTPRVWIRICWCQNVDYILYFLDLILFNISHLFLNVSSFSFLNVISLLFLSVVSLSFFHEQ